MKTLVFSSNQYFSPLIFELIQKRSLRGIVIPDYNIDFIKGIKDSGYIEDKNIFSPDVSDEAAFWEIVKSVQPEVCLVMAFPTLFKKELLEIPAKGFYNFHFGELPKYRGPDPIFWQIKNQEKEATFCIHKMDEGFDTGPILIQEKVPLIPADTHASLYQKMVGYACMKLDKTIELINDPDHKLVKQPSNNGKFFPKPQIEDVSINWETMDMEEIMAMVNAGNPWNKGAITKLNETEYRILQISPANVDHNLPDDPGLIYYADDKQGVFVICKNKQLIRIDCIYASQGYISMGRIIGLGLIKGKKFESKTI